MGFKLGKLKVLMNEMALLTEPECATSCVQSEACNRCCDLMYCEITEQYAKELYGITLERVNHPRLLFMGPTGCTVEPYLRPRCTLHTCDINSIGFKPLDREWTNEYFILREKIDLLLYETELERIPSIEVGGS